MPKLTQRIFHLSFPDDPELDALNIVSRSVPLGMLLDSASLGAEVEGIDLNDTTAVRDALSVSTAEGLVGMFDHFGSALVSWDLTEDDPDRPGRERPVPATIEGVRAQDAYYMLQIVGVWMDAILGKLPGPLSPGSNGGGRSAPPQMPMASPLSSPSS